MPAIERAAVAIQATPLVRTAPASSPATPTPTMDRHTRSPVGASLASDRARSGRNPVNTSCADCTGLIAGKAGSFNGSAYTEPGGSWPCRRSSAQRSQSRRHLLCWLHRPHRRQRRLPQWIGVHGARWELALPAIERAAVAIQSTPLVLTAPASSPATPTPTMDRRTRSPVGAGLASDRARSGRNPVNASCADCTGLAVHSGASTARPCSRRYWRSTLGT
ncbi:cytochrome c5 [Pseudomonas sp. 2835]